MSKTELMALMKIISRNYRNYYKDEQEIREAATVMYKVLEPWDFQLIEKALLKFMESASAFPPNAGQLISLAKEIRREEWEKRQREINQLPEPEKKVPCPPGTWEKIQNLFRMTI
jgi:DNA-directed RNA polymerase specialized sigma24 family protein